MADHQFEDADLAALYDVFCPWWARDDLEFYLPMVMAADAVLDVGCGTGMLLHRARDDGHRGRLCGLDPAAGMLGCAANRSDVEWVRGDLATAAWEDELFDFVVMTGHAFQVLVTADELRTALAAVRRLLTTDGRFAFETRNPAARAWERWTPEHAVEMSTPDGTAVRMEHRVEAVTSEAVSFATTYSSPAWDGPQVSRSTLRFLTATELDAFLRDAGLVVHEQYGDWDRSPLTDASPEIITVVGRA